MSTTLATHQENALFDMPYDSPMDEGRSKLLLVLIAALAVVALCLSGYLTWTTWSAGSVAGCSSDGLIDCDHVLASNWSKWFGLPISLFGSLTYVGILAVCWPAARSSSGIAQTILLALAMLAAGAAMWFIGLQLVVLQSICIYCMAVHTCGLTIGVLTLLLLREATMGPREDQMRALLGVTEVATESASQSDTASLTSFHPLIATGVAAVGLSVLMIGQYFFQPAGLKFERVAEASTADAGGAAAANNPIPTANEQIEPANLNSDDDSDSVGELATTNDESELAPSPAISSKPASAQRRLMNFSGLSDPIDIYDVPVLGNPEAEHIIVEMMDYTCVHCRHLHHHVHAALERYGDQVAFVVYHAPLSKKCNAHVVRDRPVHMYACDYARLALGVWKLDPTKFTAFHEWLMESKKPPSVFEARQKAMKLVGEKILLDKALKADLFRGFASNSNVVKEVRSGLPLLITEDGIIRGFPKDQGEWFMFLEELLDIKPLDELSE